MKTVKFIWPVRNEHELREMWSKASALTRSRKHGQFAPIRYSTKRFATRVHPDDVVALREFCEQLTGLSSDA